MYSLSDQESRKHFELSLGNNAPQSERSFFWRNGIAINLRSTRDFNFAIGSCMHCSGENVINFDSPALSRNAPIIGDRMTKDHIPIPRHRDSLKCVKITYPSVFVNAADGNNTLSSSAFAELLASTRHAIDDMETRLIMAAASGIIGNEEGYEIAEEQSLDNLGLEINLKRALEALREANGISSPSHHIAAWQTSKSFGRTISYSATTAGLALGHLHEIKRWLESSRSRGGYRFQRSSFATPGWMRDGEDPLSPQDIFFLIASPQIVDTWKASDEWERCEERIRLFLDITPSQANGFVGMKDDIAILRSDQVPRFEKNSKKFTAALFLGRMALVTGHHHQAGTPYKSHLAPNSEGSEGSRREIFCQAIFGVKQLCFPKPTIRNPGSHHRLRPNAPIVSCGACRLDIQEE